MKLDSATTYESVVGNRLLLKSDPKKGFAAEKEAILQDESIRKMFREICKQKFPDCDAAVNTVYNITAKKIVHVGYAVQFRRFKEKAVKMKNKIALRNHLKVAAAHLNGQAKKQPRKSSSRPSWKKARCDKGLPSKKPSKKKAAEGLPQPTSEESKMARKRRREILDRRRLNACL